MNKQSTEKVLFLQITLFFLPVLSIVLMDLNVIGKMEVVLVFVFSLIGFFYSLGYETKTIESIIRTVSEESTSSLTKTKKTVFSGTEYNFKYKNYPVIISLSRPYRCRVLDLGDFFRGSRLRREIYFYIGYSSSRVVSANILFGEPLQNPSAQKIHEKYSLSFEIAESILKLKNGKVYLRQDFLIFADKRNIIISNAYIKEKLEILGHIAAALEKG